MENVRDIKRHPEKVLNSLAKHSGNSDYRFERLYRNLFNEEMFYIAYQNIYANTGNMTEGTDGKTIDEMSLSRIERLIDALKNEAYQPRPARRTYIPKRNGKKRPLGIPSSDDKLVQEVIRMMLQAMYEGNFSHQSHGFRPFRSCQTALIQVQKVFTGTKWFIEGDIKGFFDNINHDIMINTLKERIDDDRFIRLIRKFLNAGYIEDWVFHNTYSGTPQGGIISPILANIYLDKFDKYVEEYIKSFDKGSYKRTERAEQKKIRKEIACLVKKLETEEDETNRNETFTEIRELRKQKFSIPYSNEMDDRFKRLKYVRYADDFLIGVIGSKEDCKQIKEDLKAFLYNKLQLELSDEKTLITHSETPAKFLGFEVAVERCNVPTRNKAGNLIRLHNKKVILNLPTRVIKEKLVYYNAVEFKLHNGHEVWKPKSRMRMRNIDDLEILTRYNSEIRGFYNFYCIANNVSKMHSFKYMMEYSMYKTFAGKHKSTVRKILRKYQRNKNFTVSYTNKKGESKSIIFYNKGFRKKSFPDGFDTDSLPNTNYTMGNTSLVDRLKARECELCGDSNDLEMHHVKRVKDLKGKKKWEILMIARRRKTLAVCHRCHRKIHNGE